MDIGQTNDRGPHMVRLDGSNAGSGFYSAYVDDPPSQSSPSGNNVPTEEQVATPLTCNNPTLDQLPQTTVGCSVDKTPEVSEPGPQVRRLGSMYAAVVLHVEANFLGDNIPGLDPRPRDKYVQHKDFA